MHWAPPAASVTSEPDSVSASLVWLASVATDVRSTTLALAPKAANVSLRGWSEAGGKDVAQLCLCFPPVSGKVLSHLALHHNRSWHFCVHTLYGVKSVSSFSLFRIFF